MHHIYNVHYCLSFMWNIDLSNGYFMHLVTIVYFLSYSEWWIWKGTFKDCEWMHMCIYKCIYMSTYIGVQHAVWLYSLYTCVMCDCIHMWKCVCLSMYMSMYVSVYVHGRESDA